MLTMRGRAVCDAQTAIAADVAAMSTFIMNQMVYRLNGQTVRM